MGHMGNICVLLPKEGFFKGFILRTSDGPVEWKHLEKEGCFFICSVNHSELELKCSAPLDSFYYRKDKGIPLFHISPFRVVCSKSSHFSMVVGEPGSNGTERNSQPTAGGSFQVTGNDKLGGKDSSSIPSSVVGLAAQRAIQKNESCFSI